MAKSLPNKKAKGKRGWNLLLKKTRKKKKQVLVQKYKNFKTSYEGGREGGA